MERNWWSLLLVVVELELVSDTMRERCLGGGGDAECYT